MKRYVSALVAIGLAVQTVPFATVLGLQAPPQVGAASTAPAAQPTPIQPPPGLVHSAPRPRPSPTPAPPPPSTHTVTTSTAAPAAAAVLQVPQQYASIQAALQVATSGDTVQVASGTYFEHSLYIPPGVVLAGSGRTSTIIDGGGVSGVPIINVDSGATVSGFTLKDGGSNYWDAAVWLLGGATVTNNYIEHTSMGIVRYCFTTPCVDTSNFTNNLVAHDVNAGILVNGAGASVEYNTIVDTTQAITFVADGASGRIDYNIISNANTGVTAPATVLKSRNLFFQTPILYGVGTNPESSDFQADPLFVDAASDNYSLFSGSPARILVIGLPTTLGAFPFTPTGAAPTSLSVIQTPQGLQLSWPTTGAAGYYVYSNAPGGQYFSRPIDKGSATSALIPLPPPGTYKVAVSSYAAQHRESEITEATINVAGVILSPTVAAIGQTVAVTVTGYSANETVTLSMPVSCTGVQLTSGIADGAGVLATSFVVPSDQCTVVHRADLDLTANAGTSVSITATGATSGLTTATTLAIPGTSVSAYAEGASVYLSGIGFMAGEQVSFVFKPTQSQTSLPAAIFPADNTGHVGGIVPLPNSLTNSTYTVAGTGLSSGFTATMPGIDPSWQWQNPLPQGNPLRSVSCLTSTTCFAVGDLGTLMTTTNGGSSWTNRTIGGGPTTGAGAYLTGISCPSSTTCFAANNNGILATTDAGQTWTYQTQTPGFPYYLTAISCPNSTTCFAVGEQYNTFDEVVLATTNGGVTWTNQFLGISTAYLYSISCPTSTSCVAVGSDSNGDEVILATTNAGTLWASQNVGVAGYLGGINCPSSTTCFAVGSDSTGNAAVLATTNAGATWADQTTNVQGQLDGISCTNGATCIAVGYGGLVLATTNGISWTGESSTVTANLYGVDCTSGTGCIAVGDDGIILNTANGGSTWTGVIAGTQFQFGGISCPTNELCFAAGYNTTTGNGAILTTSNDGESWISRTTGTTAALAGISCPSATACFAVGAGGVILATTNGGTSWVSQPPGPTTNLTGISCPSAASCFVVGAGGLILATTNGGTSWFGQPTGNLTNLAGISCPSTTVCFAVGANGVILATTNGGTSWVNQGTSGTASLAGVDCPSSTTCYVVGAENVNYGSYYLIGNMLLITHDGGTTWSSPSPDYYDSYAGPLTSISCPSVTTCFTVGDYGNMFVSTDGGISWNIPQLGASVSLTGISCPDLTVCTTVGPSGAILSDRPLTAPTIPTAASVTVTNLTGSGFAVTFTTSSPASAVLLYGTSPSALTSTTYDDRDGAGPAATAGTVHRFTLPGLTAGTTYYFEPSVLGVSQPAVGGSPYSQVVPTIHTIPPLPHQVTGSVLLQDGTVPAPATVLLQGYWTNPDGSRSLPVSVLNTPAGTQNLNYTIGASALNQAGTDFFPLTVGSSVFHVTGAGDDNGELGTGGPVTATLAATITKLPSFNLSLFVTCTYQVQVGWNFITLCLSPASPIDAQTILTDLLADTNGGYAELDSYSNGQWTPSLFDDPGDGIGLGGTNFTLQLAKGYALYSDKAGSFSVTGTPAVAQPVSLSAGWNLVGFPEVTVANPLQADSFLTGLIGQTHGGYAEIDGYSNGQFSPSAFDDPADGIGLGGTNFSVQSGQGYAVYTDTNATQDL